MTRRNIPTEGQAAGPPAEESGASEDGYPPGQYAPSADLPLQPLAPAGNEGDPGRDDESGGQGDTGDDEYVPL